MVLVNMFDMIIGCFDNYVAFRRTIIVVINMNTTYLRSCRHVIPARIIRFFVEDYSEITVCFVQLFSFLKI
jgi:hypothetical protein